jgi:hypothetical protein
MVISAVDRRYIPHTISDLYKYMARESKFYDGGLAMKFSSKYSRASVTAICRLLLPLNLGSVKF